MKRSVPRRRPRTLPLRSVSDPRIHGEPLSDKIDDVIDELHTVSALLQLLERIAGILPTDTFVDGAFTAGQLHAVATAARDRVGALLERTAEA